jgi:hypothetical protein
MINNGAILSIVVITFLVFIYAAIFVYVIEHRAMSIELTYSHRATTSSDLK